MDVITIDLDGGALGARSWPGGSGRPVLLVHGLSSNARLWDETAQQLAAAGHPVVAVDLRGHGASADVPDPDVPEPDVPEPDGTGPDVPDSRPDATRRAAADLAAACATLGWAEPVVAGQSWGGNVVLQLAADRPSLVHGLALVDGGWLHLSDRFAGLEQAWAVLAPPRFDGLTADALQDRLRAGHPGWSPTAIAATAANLQRHGDGTVTPWLTRERHRAIVASMLAQRPRELYPLVTCPVLLLVAGTDNPQAKEALAELADARLVEFPGGDHDLHAQHPDRVAALIGELA